MTAIAVWGIGFLIVGSLWGIESKLARIARALDPENEDNEDKEDKPEDKEIEDFKSVSTADK